MRLSLYKVKIRGELRLMTTRFKQISKNNLYKYAKVSLDEQS